MSKNEKSTINGEGSDASACYVNKDGTANKVYVRKMWNHVMETMIDSYNGDINRQQFEKRVKQFRCMVNDLVLHNSQRCHGKAVDTRTTIDHA